VDTDTDNSQQMRSTKHEYCLVKTDEVEGLSDLETPSARRAALRVAAVASAVAAAFVVITCTHLYSYRSATSTPRSKATIDGFVNFQADAAVAPWIKPKPQLCNMGVVLDVCLRLQHQQTSASYGSSTHTNRSWIDSRHLSEFFMVSQGSIDRFLINIGAENQAFFAGGFKVTCLELCHNTVASFGTGVLPAMVDVGCYYLNACTINAPPPAVPAQTPEESNFSRPQDRRLWGSRPPSAADTTSSSMGFWARTWYSLKSLFKRKPDVSTIAPIAPPAYAPTCAVDVSLSVLAQTEIPSGNSDRLLDQFLGSSNQTLTMRQRSRRKIFDDVEKVKPEDVQAHYSASHPEVSFNQLQLMVARLFRIFPASKNVTLQVTLPNTAVVRKLWDDSCKSAKNGFCDTPHSCADGTDCTDCGTCDGRYPDDSCEYRKDDVCDEPRYCLAGTDCTDCGTCGFGGQNLTDFIKTMKPNDNCQYAKDGTCDVAPLCDEGTDCTDCNTCRTALHYQPGEYGMEIMTAGVKSTALLSTALLGIQSGQGSQILMDYIGKDDPQIRSELRRVISGTSRMLDNVDYVYPGTNCKINTYAYVQVDRPPKGGGKFKYFLCDAFMEANAGEQFMALLETGMHQQNMLAETILLDGSPVVGESMVKKLAAKCKDKGLEWCDKSIRNSQSILFVINRFARLGL